MAYTKDDLLLSSDIISNWSTLNSLAYIRDPNTTNISAQNDEIDDLRYGMTTTVILM